MLLSFHTDRKGRMGTRSRYAERLALLPQRETIRLDNNGLASSVDALGPVLVLWRHRLLVDGRRQPLVLDPAALPGVLPVPLGPSSPGDAAAFVELDPAREGVSQLAAVDGVAAARFIDPMFELGTYAQPLRGRIERALAISRWSAQTRFCSECGAPLGWEIAGALKICSNPDEPHRHFPRLDPATIMLVHDGDRMLLGRQPDWPEGMYSTLAGFVEPGESAEDAVAREVFEEAGVRVGAVRYFGSEPWPFPRSLMLGFFAQAETTELVRGDELDDVRWFDVADGLRLQALLAERMPRADTIARRLIAAWLGERAPRTRVS
jgi:NAD+ diphosphatase